MPNIENKLIARLPRSDRLHLLAVCEPVVLVFATVLCERSKPTRYVYFPKSGFISLVTILDDHPGVEVGMVGDEGMLGAELALGVTTTPLDALVQGQGAALRVDADAFCEELSRSKALRCSLHRYIHLSVMQLATSAACLRFHLLGPRLARCLLMTQDRAHSARFNITHEFLANMLGVRRVGITRAAGLLQREGLIEYHRGELTVIDRDGLEAAACSCYATDQESYRNVLQ